MHKPSYLTFKKNEWGVGGLCFGSELKVHIIKHYIYFIQEDKKSKSSPVKIGLAKDPIARLRYLQVGNPRRLILRQTIGPVSRMRAAELEKKFHKKFSRLNLRGEWFSGKVLDRINQCIK